MLMIWLRGNYWETRNMSFCEGGRGEALKSRCRNGLNGGGKSLRWRRGHKERTGMYGCRRMVAASWGSFHLKASHRAGKKVLYFRVQLYPEEHVWLYRGSSGSSQGPTQHASEIQPIDQSLSWSLRASKWSVIIRFLLKYVTLISPQTELFNIYTTNSFWEWALSRQTVESEHSVDGQRGHEPQGAYIPVLVELGVGPSGTWKNLSSNVK